MNRRWVWVAIVIALSMVIVIAAAAWWGMDREPLADSSPSPTLSPTPTVTPTPSPSPSASASPSPSPSPEPTFDTAAFSIDQADSLWVVVNKHRPLSPADHIPDDLVALDGIPGGGSQRMTEEAAAAFFTMYADLQDADLVMRVATAYRSYNFQAGIFNDRVNEVGRAAAQQAVARPGYSEHQTGLAVDVYQSEACRLRFCFGDEETGQWIAANSADYGFIVRYPRGVEDITGYQYEPWHLRYVGVDLALEMRERDVFTLEDFFGLDPAADYLD